MNGEMKGKEKEAVNTRVLIIGKGPAGLSAAIYLKRAGIDVTVVGMGVGALEKAERIENYYGLRPAGGVELARRGEEQAAPWTFLLAEDEIVGLTYEDRFVVVGKEREYRAAAVLLATGASQDLEDRRHLRVRGKGISYCAVCDAFFIEGRTSPSSETRSSPLTRHRPWRTRRNRHHLHGRQTLSAELPGRRTKRRKSLSPSAAAIPSKPSNSSAERPSPSPACSSPWRWREAPTSRKIGAAVENGEFRRREHGHHRSRTVRSGRLHRRPSSSGKGRFRRSRRRHRRFENFYKTAARKCRHKEN